jgi:hypothetical protein
MTGLSLHSLAARAIRVALAAMLVCSCAVAPFGSAKARIEGVYSLQEWHLGGEIVRPPLVDGRFLLLDGAVITVLHNKVKEANQTTVASYGSYLLDGTTFSYRYDDTTVLVQTDAAATVSRKVPWEGMRSFALSSESNVVRLRSDNGQQEFLFTPDGLLTYSENGKVQRVWQRVIAKK